jgi:hypothetical protein
MICCEHAAAPARLTGVSRSHHQLQVRQHHRMPSQAALAGLGLLACGLAHATATVVIDGGAPNQALRFNADIVTQLTTAATAVTLGSAVQFNQFDWWGAYSGGMAGPSDSFQLIIYSAANNLPVAPIFAESLGNGGETLTGKAFPSGALEYSYSASFPALTLPAGQYFFGMQRGGGNGSTVWGWEQTSGGPQLGGGTFDQLGRWTASPAENLAFQALGTTAPVPEPSTAIFMTLGVGGLLLVMRRRACVPTVDRNRRDCGRAQARAQRTA